MLAAETVQAPAEPLGVIPADNVAEAISTEAPLRKRRLTHPLAAVSTAAILGTAAGLAQQSGVQAVVAGLITFVLVVLAAWDLDQRVIPNRLVLPATALVLVVRIAEYPGRASVFVLAPLAIGAALLLPNLIKPASMGMGDVKLAAFLGAALGWGAIGAVAIAFLALFPFALATLVRGGAAARRATLPFGPFLALGGIIILILPRLLGIGG